jgi:hypothetical protein
MLHICVCIDLQLRLDFVDNVSLTFLDKSNWPTCF